LLALVGATLSAATHEVSGRVVDAQTGEPIGRARVTLRVNQGNQPSEVPVLTDPDGSFRFTNVPEGNWSQLQIEKAGYLPASQGLAIPAGDAKAAPVIFRLTAQAALEGTVVDDRGLPVPNAIVQLMRQTVNNGRRQSMAAYGAGTDETGYFRAFRLAAGRYYIAFSAHPRGARAKTLAYPLLYYPNTTDIAGAQAFDLRPGQEQKIEMHLPEPMPAREIRGEAVTSSPWVNMQLHQAGSFSAVPPYLYNWDPKSKTFKISGIVAGVYDIEAFGQGNNQQVRASTTITVGNSDVTGLRLELAGTTLKATVRLEGSDTNTRPLSSFRIQSDRYSSGSSVDADGTWHVDNAAAGTYRVALQPNGSLCARSIRQGDRDVLANGLAIPEVSAPEPLEIVMTSHCGAIEGTVSLPDSNQPAPVAVALLRPAGAELAMETQTFTAVAPGAPSHFAMRGITPGDYVLYAWPAEAQIEYANPEFMKQFTSYGQAVTVTEDGRVTVTIDRLLPRLD